MMTAALAFPSFVAQNNLVGTNSLTAAQIEGSEFNARAFNSDQVSIFFEPVDTGVVDWGFPYAAHHGGPEYATYRSVDDYWRGLSVYLSGFFGCGTDAGHTAVLAWSNRVRQGAEIGLGVSSADPRWREAESRLGGAAKFFDSGDLALYQPTTCAIGSVG
jgi:hypothetical protein